MLLLYFGFAAAVACWTLYSELTATAEMKFFYLLTVLVLLAAETVMTFAGRKKKNLYSCGTAALILANAGRIAGIPDESGGNRNCGRGIAFETIF